MREQAIQGKKMDSLGARSDGFEHQTKALAQYTCFVPRRPCWWSGLVGLLGLSLLGLAVPVQNVKAQAGASRVIPISNCTNSMLVFRLSGLPVPSLPTVICAINEDDQFQKSRVQFLSVNWYGDPTQFPADSVKVRACSQTYIDRTAAQFTPDPAIPIFLDPSLTLPSPPLFHAQAGRRCTPFKTTTSQIGPIHLIVFNNNDLVGAPEFAWASPIGIIPPIDYRVPATLFGYVEIQFAEGAVVTGILATE